MKRILTILLVFLAFAMAKDSLSVYDKYTRGQNSNMQSYMKELDQALRLGTKDITVKRIYADSLGVTTTLGGTSFSGTTSIDTLAVTTLNQAGLQVITQTPQTLTGAGAVNITSAITYIATTGADALTLADGTQGQIKYLVCTAFVGNGTLTPTNLGNGTTVTFDSLGDTAILLFVNGNWYFIGGTATLA